MIEISLESFIGTLNSALASDPAAQAILRAHEPGPADRPIDAILVDGRPIRVGDPICVEGESRGVPRLARCRTCGRAPSVETNWLAAQSGRGPFVIRCVALAPRLASRFSAMHPFSLLLSRSFVPPDGRRHVVARSSSYDRVVEIWQRENGGRDRRGRRERRAIRRRRRARRGW